MFSLVVDLDNVCLLMNVAVIFGTMDQVHILIICKLFSSPSCSILPFEVVHAFV